MIRLVPLLLFLPGCVALGLGGSVDGEELAFAEAVYIEQAGTDPGTSLPFHDLDLWLMPAEGSCEAMPTLLAGIVDLREEMDLGRLEPAGYCEAWEDLFEEAFGLDPFWVAHARLRALPRDEGQEVDTTYGFRDDAQSGQGDGPKFDLDLARYPAPVFDACSTEFSGDGEEFGPTLYAADGGTIEITDYQAEDSITATLRPHVDEQDSENLEGEATAELCRGALDWSLVFGLGR